MNQRWRLVALWLLPIGVVLLIGWQVISNGGLNSQNAGGTTVAPRNAAVARMSYGRFLDYVEAGRVTAVDIYDGGRNAVIEAVDPDLDNRVQRLRVDLPGLAPELVNTLKEEGISFDIHPPRTAPPALGLLGNLLFPLLLIGSLIFLARRNSGMPGGPGQAMQFGKSKARFMSIKEADIHHNQKLCAWCEKPFIELSNRGSAQKFCNVRCKSESWSAKKRYTEYLLRRR